MKQASAEFAGDRRRLNFFDDVSGQLAASSARTNLFVGRPSAPPTPEGNCDCDSAEALVTAPIGVESYKP